MTTDFSKLKVAPDSQFFDFIKDGNEIELYFFNPFYNYWMKVKWVKVQKIKQLISSIGAGEWRKSYQWLHTHNFKPKRTYKKYIEAKEQIKLWEGIAE